MAINDRVFFSLKHFGAKDVLFAIENGEVVQGGCLQKMLKTLEIQICYHKSVHKIRVWLR